MNRKPTNRKRYIRGEPEVDITYPPSDIKSLLRFIQYPFQPSNWFRRLDGRNPQDLTLRLRYFFDHGILGRIDSLAKDKHICYFLTDKGHKLLADRGCVTDIPTRNDRENAHNILGSIVNMSFLIGTEENPDFTLFTWNQLVHHQHLP